MLITATFFATQMVEAGQLRPAVYSLRFTLDNALQAHEAMERGNAVGKIVVDVAV